MIPKQKEVSISPTILLYTKKSSESCSFFVVKKKFDKVSLLRRRMIDCFQFSQNNLEARHPFYHFRSFNPRKFINCERRIRLIAILDMHLVKMLCLPIRKKPCSPKRLCFSVFILASMFQEVLKTFFTGPQCKDLCFHHKKKIKISIYKLWLIMPSTAATTTTMGISLLFR